MDTVAIASYLVQGQMAQTQGELAATLINQQQNMQDQVVSLLGSATQNASASVSMGTGEYINIIA